MSQHDMVLNNAAGAAFRSDANNALQALASTSKGGSRPATAFAGQFWVDDDTPSSTLWTVLFFDGVDDIPVGRLDTTANRFLPFGAAHGQCRLSKSGDDLVLSPLNGNVLIIGGAPEVVPSAGVSLAATGLTPGTLYYAYAYMNSGAMTLEASTTVPATDSVTGVAVKTGDATRTLVGMGRPVTGPAWADSATQRLTLSYFNRRPLPLLNNFTTTRSTNQAPYVEVHTETRVEFLTWADEAVQLAAGGSAGVSATQIAFTGIGVDSTSSPSGQISAAQAFTANATVPYACSVLTTLSAGYHFATLLAGTGGGATANFNSNGRIAGLVRG